MTSSIRGATVLVALLVLVVTSSACGRSIDNSQHVAAMKAALSGTPAWLGDAELDRTLWDIERRFYEARGYLPAWIDGDQPTSHWADLTGQLRYAVKHGLEPQAYGVAEFEKARQESQTRYRGTRFDPLRVPELDMRMTHAYLRHAADLLGWGARARQVYVHWLVEPREEDLSARLQQALDSGRVRDSLESLAPSHSQYGGLQAALAREVEEPTGRADTLKMNLERWRWTPRDLGDQYVLINVPAYQMQVMDGDEPVLAMRVIVGEPETPTPLFSDEMTYVVFSPYWNIPESILRSETLPRLARDPDYLRRNNLEIVGTDGIVAPESIDWSDEGSVAHVRLRQAPGPENALGLVKFIFPNHFNVYLHDTPGDRLFFREQRALSHGCIRIENPVAMAEYVLRDRADWDRDRIIAAMNGQREEAITLKRRLPVHIGYWTAWVEADGTVTYTGDPYKIDEAHARQRAGRPRPVTGAPTGA